MNKTITYLSVAALLLVSFSCNAMRRNIGWDQETFAKARNLAERTQTPPPPRQLPKGASRKKFQQEWGSEEVRLACMKVVDRVREEEKAKLRHSRKLAKKILGTIQKRKDAHKERNTLNWDY